MKYYHAAKNNHLDMVKYLISKGVNKAIKIASENHLCT